MKIKVLGPSFPIFNDGTARYNIVTDDDDQIVIATHMFVAADHRHPDYQRYMTDQRAIANAICAAFSVLPDTVESIVLRQQTIRSTYFPTKK